MDTRNKFSDFSIQTRLVILFLLTSMLIFLVNIFVYANLNKMIGQIEDIYASNVNLNDLSEILGNVQDNMTEYLKTKNTDYLEDYYKYEQEYFNKISELNNETTNNELKLMEKCIRNMSETYLDITDDTVQAKRGRNVEKYIKSYDDASEIYNYLSNYIYSLNNEQFKQSSSRYVDLLESLKYAEIFCLSIIILIAICNILLIILATQSITLPLRALAMRANEVSKGKFDGEILEISSKDEVGVVTRAFNQMILSIREYIEQIKERMETESAMKEKELMMTASLKDAQLKYLQAQINPHFLFNTLNAGAQLAMLEGAERTNTYVQKMADFFRYNIKKNNDVVTIRDEIELVDNYIYILNVRFSGDIHYEKDVDERLISTQMPSMILQPIMENAVNYGIRNIDWEGIVKLSVYEDDDRICISIKDNGIGMEEELIRKILSDDLVSEELSKDSNGIGLSNVISRLDLYYSVENLFSIISEGTNKGTEMIIRIPINS